MEDFMMNSYGPSPSKVEMVFQFINSHGPALVLQLLEIWPVYPQVQLEHSGQQ